MYVAVSRAIENVEISGVGSTKSKLIILSNSVGRN